MQADDVKRNSPRPRIIGIASARSGLMADPADSVQECGERAEADLRRAREDMLRNARRAPKARARSRLSRAKLLEEAEKGFAGPCGQEAKDE
jgi:hypothetical protein